MNCTNRCINLPFPLCRRDDASIPAVFFVLFFPSFSWNCLHRGKRNACGISTSFRLHSTFDF